VSEASVRNPVDMIASAPAEHYGRAIRALGTADEIDAIIVMFIPPIVTRPDEVADEILAARVDIDRDVTLVGVFMTREGAPTRLHTAIPTFAFPENAARALGRIASWESWRRRPTGRVIRPEVDTCRARAVIAGQPAGGDGWLTATDAQTLLDAYGIPTARARRIRTPQEAASAHRQIGDSVVVKIAAPIHKSDLGGVRVGITTPEVAADAVSTIRANLEALGRGDAATEFLVQEHIRSGCEMIIGVNHDPIFGPLVMVGLGGGLVELLGDVAVRITPLTDVDVDEMLRSLKAYALLTGYRGSPPLDIDALRDVLYRVSALVEDLPEIAELDLNPVFVLQHGAKAADVRVRIHNQRAPGNEPATVQRWG
jgi:acyl-CoA synthetase (NDP forming)